jgi:hypothetical protein
MLVLAILVVIVSLGIVFLAYFFVNLCRDSRKGHAIVFVEVVGGTAIERRFLSPGHSSTQTSVPSIVTEEKRIQAHAGSSRWALSSIRSR